MRITIINESGDCKEMLYTKDMVTYEVTSQEITDFFNQLADSYSNNEKMDDMYECLYNLINYGYLYSEDEEEIDYDSYDYDDDEDYDYYEYEDDDYTDKPSKSAFNLMYSVVEYYVDGELTSKELYDDAWDDRIGYLGSSNWEEKGLSIINADTDEIIFSGKISWKIIVYIIRNKILMGLSH